MIDALFPHGAIIVFFAIFIVFLIGMGLGNIFKGKVGALVASALVGLIISYKMYHIIGLLVFPT